MFSGVSSRTSSPIPSSCSIKKTPLTSGSFSSEETQSPVMRGTTIVKPCAMVSVVRKNPCNETSAIPTSTIMSESSEEATSPQQLLDPQTMLPRSNKNQFIVAATIHKVDA
jgi:hypothetical protein